MAYSGKSLTLDYDKASMTSESAVLKAILTAVPTTAGNIAFTAVPSDLSAFPDAAALTGLCPVIMAWMPKSAVIKIRKDSIQKKLCLNLNS